MGTTRFTTTRRRELETLIERLAPNHKTRQKSKHTHVQKSYAISTTSGSSLHSHQRLDIQACVLPALSPLLRLGQLGHRRLGLLLLARTRALFFKTGADACRTIAIPCDL